MTAPGGVALAGAVAIDVEPEARDFYPKLRAQVLPAADLIGREIGQRISAPMVTQLSTGMREGLRAGGRGATPDAVRAGNEIGRTVGEAARARLELALKNLPEITIDGDSTALERKAAAVRERIAALKADIELGLDDAEAEARLRIIRTQMSGLARDVEKVREAGGTIPLNLDAIKAGVELTRFLDEVKAARREAERPIKLKVETGGAFETELKAKVEKAIAALPHIELKADSTDAERDLARIRAELVELHSKRIGVDIDADAAIAKAAALQAELDRLAAEAPNVQVRVDAAKAGAQLAAVAAQARAVGAISPTVNVDVDTGGAIASIAALVSSAAAGRFALIVLASAGGLLGTLVVPAAASAAAAIGAIGPAAIAALLGVGVLILAFSGVFGALQKVNQGQGAAARSGVDLAAKQDAIRNAELGVTQAHRSLIGAEQDALRAEQDLTKAREAARQAMEDLNSAVANGALAQRGALLDLADAQQRLDDVMTNPQSTQIERQRAQLTYDQAKQQIDDLAVRQGRLVAQQQDAQRKGIEGSDQVTAAYEKIAQTQQRVVEATEGLERANRSLAAAYRGSGAAGAAAGKQGEDALAKLSPAGRAFVAFLLTLKPLLGQLSAAAQTGLLPGLQAGITALLPVMPQIVGFVGILAKAMGDLFAAAGRALASPFWVTFFTQLAQFAGPAIATFASTIGDLAKGFATLLLAFLPFSAQFGAGIADMAAKFAVWAATFVQSDGFKKFIAYVTENGPKLLALVGDLLVVVVKLGIGLAPLAKVVLDVALAIAQWLASLSPGELTLLAGAIGAVIAVIAIAAGGPILAVVAGIALVVGALVYAWTHFKTFRDVVLTVWHAIETAAIWLWQNVLKPTFEFIAAAIAVVAAVALWLWHNVFDPVFTAIGAIVSWWWDHIGKPIFEAVGWVISNVIGPLFLWLWHHVIEPVWTGIKVAISVAWAIIEVIFGLVQIAVKILAGIFLWLWHNVISPVWEGIHAAISYVWKTFIKPIFTELGDIIEKYVAPAFKRGVDAIGKAWDAIKDVAKIPVKFVVNTILNDGLLAAYNWIAKTFNVKPDNVKINLPAGFAGGGYVMGAGGPTDDAILARLSNGEYVIPANIVRRYGVSFFDQIIGGGGVPGGRPGDGSEGLALPGFAEGGFVGFLRSAWNTIKDPVEYIRGKVGDIIGNIPGVGYVKSLLSGLSNTMVGGLLRWVKGKITNVFTGSYAGPVSGEVADVQAWIRTQAGKPYIWAAAGPQGYDCSGMQSAVWNLMHGKPPYAHTFSTSNEAAYFPLPGLGGVHSVGYAHAGERGGGRVGHTAGNLAGLPFESRGGDGVVVGAGVTPLTSFARLGHYDSGGWLMPGLTLAYNGTGQPERISTAGQWRTIADQVSGGGGDTVTYAIYPQTTNLDAAQLAGITAAEEVRHRLRRPR